VNVRLLEKHPEAPARTTLQLFEFHS